MFVSKGFFSVSQLSFDEAVKLQKTVRICNTYSDSNMKFASCLVANSVNLDG